MAISKEQLWESEFQKWLEKKSLKDRERDLDTSGSHPVIVSNQPIAQMKFLLNDNFEFKMVSPNLAHVNRDNNMLDAFSDLDGLAKLQSKRFKYPTLIRTITKQFNLVSKQGWKSSETRMDMTTVDLPLRHPLNGVFHSSMIDLEEYSRAHFAEGWCAKHCAADADWKENQLHGLEVLGEYDRAKEREIMFWESRKGWVVWQLTSMSCFHSSMSVQQEIIDSMPEHLSECTSVK
tara:strand:+ start:156 stop:857 length:702 start_codon:yes stop_codon:yes gene_type:complete